MCAVQLQKRKAPRNGGEAVERAGTAPSGGAAGPQEGAPCSLTSIKSHCLSGTEVKSPQTHFVITISTMSNTQSH